MRSREDCRLRDRRYRPRSPCGLMQQPLKSPSNRNGLHLTDIWVTRMLSLYYFFFFYFSAHCDRFEASLSASICVIMIMWIIHIGDLKMPAIRNKRERAALRSGEGANVFTSIALYVHCVHTSKYGCTKSTTGTCMMHPYGSKSQASSKPPHILV